MRCISIQTSKGTGQNRNLQLNIESNKGILTGIEIGKKSHKQQAGFQQQQSANT